jgi:hypothetical protein
MHMIGTLAGAEDGGGVGNWLRLARELEQQQLHRLANDWSP